VQADIFSRKNLSYEEEAIIDLRKYPSHSGKLIFHAAKGYVEKPLYYIKLFKLTSLFPLRDF